MTATAPSKPTMAAQTPPRLIIPERNENSFEWVRETREMLEQGPARVRVVDFDNAPFGRDVVNGSIYRWWLAAMAGLDHLVSGHTGGTAVEYGGLLADPVLLVLGMGGLGWLVWRRFGSLSLGVLVAGLVGFFPLAAAFVPGVPDVRGLTALLVVGQITVLAATLDPGLAPSSRRPGFVLAGLLGGLTFWINVPVATALLVSLAGGAIAGLFLQRTQRASSQSETILPWRWWSATGAVTILLSYLLEYAPAHLGGWRLDVVHPAYGFAWLGLGEIAAQADAAFRLGQRSGGVRRLATLLSALIGVATPIVIVAVTGHAGWTSRDLLWARLDNLSDGVTATNVFHWFGRDGMGSRAWATLLPFAVVIPAGFALVRKPRDLRVAIALCPVLLLGGVAIGQLSWWTYGGAAVLAAGVVLTASHGGFSPALRGTALATLVVGVVAGLTVTWPGASMGPDAKLTTSESEELVERHVARWLALRSGNSGAVVFAPPHLTTTLGYYGGFRGIGTFAPENQAGFGTSLAIAGVTTMEEVQELLRSRGVRYLVLPSWDPFFDNFASLYLAGKYSHRTSYLATELRHWNLPTWLRPIPYQLPVAGDFTGQSIAIFEVVDDQSPVAAASRLTEYFVETDDLDRAVVSAASLKQYPGDVGALAAQAQVDLARNDHEALTGVVDTLVARLAAGGDRYLAWDRRVSLAMVLARSNHIDEARAQLQRTLSEANEERLRSLTTGSLFGWQVLLKAFHQEIADPNLKALASDLLPAALRERL